MNADADERPDARELAEYAQEMRLNRARRAAEAQTARLCSDDPWTPDSAYRNA